MILSSQEYHDLWDKHFNPYVGNQPVRPGGVCDYNGYIKREHALEDYLDIFRQQNTRALRGAPNSNKPHRFKDLINNNKKYAIKYVLIAEAAPEPKDDNKGLDYDNYIYLNATNGPYIREPLKAFGVQNVGGLDDDGKIKKLAENGLLILDIYPFSINYGRKKLRQSLIKLPSTSAWSFLSDPNNKYSIVSRLQYLLNANPKIRIALNNRVNTCFICPPDLSHYFASQINSTTNPALSQFHLKFQQGQNNCTHQYKKSNSITQYQIINPPSFLINSFRTQYSLSNSKRFPVFTCCGYGGANTPQAIFIQSSLNI